MAKFMNFKRESDGRMFSFNIEQIVTIEDITDKSSGNKPFDNCIISFSNGSKEVVNGSGELIRKVLNEYFIGVL